MKGDSDFPKLKENLRFKFNEKKALAAASLLLQDEGGKMEYLRLIKLLYLADREIIARRGRPIIGGNYVAMRYGLVLSGVLNCVKYGGAIWSNGIETKKYHVYLKIAPDFGPLTKEEIKALRRIKEDNKNIDKWMICKRMHDLPEWKNPKGGAIDIPHEELLQILNHTEEEIMKIRQETIERDYFDGIFGS